MIDMILLRHGRTVSNEQRRIAGSTDSPLLHGWEEYPSGLVGEIVALGPVRGVYTSPLRRARRPALAFFEAMLAPFGSVRYEEIEDLRELDFGDFEGVSYDELRAGLGVPQGRKVAHWCYSQGVDMPNGERGLATRARAQQVGRTLVEHAREYESGTMVVSTHSLFMMHLLDALEGVEPGSAQRVYVGNFQGYHLRVSPEQGRSLERRPFPAGQH